MNALISVSDKTGIAEFAAALSALGINRNTLRRKLLEHKLIK